MVLFADKRIGSIVKRVSPLGMGCWAFGGRDWGEQSDSDSIGALKAAVESGITHFDTAQAYGKGHSEEIVGKALKSKRDQLFIATKMVYTIPEKVEKSLMLSLKRLKTEYIDLMYIHWPRTNVNLAMMMEKLIPFREKGVIKGIGVSNFTVEQMKEVMKAGALDAHQVCYNLFWRWAEKDIIPFCKSNAVSVVTYSTIAQGILTGKFENELCFDSGDHRKDGVLFDKNVWPNIYNSVLEMKRLAGSIDRPLTHCAIQWVLSRDGITSALVGARNRDQVQSNISGIDKCVDDEILRQLTLLSDKAMRTLPDTGNIFRYYP